jgi:cell division protein FtsI (penicillin-binding protein 3)
MSFNRDILKRLYGMAVVFLLVAVAIVVKLVNYQILEKNDWKQLEETTVIQERKIPAQRGNIYSIDGNLLATTMPRYSIHFDPMAVESGVFEEGVKNLAKQLARFTEKNSAEWWEKELRSARAKANRYYPIAENVSYIGLKQLRTFDIFKKGKYTGGLVVEFENMREHPFGRMAERTLGYSRDGAHVGLEGAFSGDLGGVDGTQLSQRIGQDLWKPIYSGQYKEPLDGVDVISTIDVHIQDIAQQALLNTLIKFEADHGCVVVMEVETGAVRAIVNLGRTERGTYYEKLNYAVGESTEPGSTFKLAAVIAALEDGIIDTSTIVDTYGGEYEFFGSTVRDSRKGGYGKISFGHVFEVSSNVGIAKVIYDYYKSNPGKFVDRLYLMGLSQKLGVSIPGEASPEIPRPGDPKWSGLTLPWMAHGYAVRLTPLQILAFYNAIANNGTLLRPYFVDRLEVDGKVIRQMHPKVLNSSICSEKTLRKVQALLVGVVENGTATNIKSATLSMAGKTGTCKLEYWKPELKDYQASFAGYFPADKPKYSCIVVVTKPKYEIGYYGNVVAAPVFGEIARKVMAYQPDYPQINIGTTQFPVAGDVTMPSDDLQNISGWLWNESPESNGTGMMAVHFQSAQPSIKSTVVATDRMPDLRGMPISKAIPIAENLGLEVEYNGHGKVVEQSIAPGESLNNKKQLKVRAAI